MEKEDRPRKLRAAGAGRSGYSTISRDYRKILNEAVDNFYAVARVRELAAKWEHAIELTNSNRSIVAQAFAAELRKALEPPA